ncbi:hypothetical protein EJ110_NYTH03599 [Nymphaea thermarum]|nr:hypothetical protein EJ110_NYTH03599 [Nymphaea thermarum]
MVLNRGAHKPYGRCWRCSGLGQYGANASSRARRRACMKQKGVTSMEEQGGRHKEVIGSIRNQNLEREDKNMLKKETCGSMWAVAIFFLFLDY